MTISKASLLVLWAGASTAQKCASPTSLNCRMTTTPPTLDGDLDEWSNVTGVSFPLSATFLRTLYGEGNMELKCLFDDEQIYFSVEVPGAYRFDSLDNHKCASVSFMSKIGADATYYDMGGCPDARGRCPAAMGVCASYTVDLGAHWKLSTTQQRVRYAINVEEDGTSSGGNDPIANKNDEYSVSTYCRLADDGNNAGNEWAGAWSHTSSAAVTERSSSVGGVGSYIFEFSRLLQTDSPETDAQYVANNTYSFGAAFWDPFETENGGWTSAGHYVTGCSADWFDLVLDNFSPAVSLPTAGSSSQESSGSMLPFASMATVVGGSLLSFFMYAFI